MKVKIRNETQQRLTIKERYLENPNTDSGYDGAKDYPIDPGKSITISSSKFTDNMLLQRMTQQIHVTGDEKNAPLVMFCDDFKKNKEIFLEIGDDNCLRPRFVPREHMTFVQRVWACFFGPPQASGEAPLAEVANLSLAQANTEPPVAQVV